MKHRVHLVPRPVIQGKEANWTPFANAQQRNTIYNTLWSLICHAALRWKLYTIHCTHNNAIPYNTLWSMICNAASKWKLHTIRHYINDTQRSIKMKTAHHTSIHQWYATQHQNENCTPYVNTQQFKTCSLSPSLQYVVTRPTEHCYCMATKRCNIIFILPHRRLVAKQGKFAKRRQYMGDKLNNVRQHAIWRLQHKEYVMRQ